MRPPAEDYYARLGVPSTATAAELRRAYRLLALRFHPDRAGPHSTEVFQKIVLAYQVLSDAQERAAYDGTLRAAAEQAGPPVAWRPAPRRRARSPRLDRLSGPLEALIARASARRAPEDPGIIELLLTRGEAASGGHAAIEAEIPITCPTCAGVAAANRVWCIRCIHAGHIIEDLAIVVDIPPGTEDHTVFGFNVDPTGIMVPLRVRIRVE
jgi:DnaJ-class molecular chaperone